MLWLDVKGGRDVFTIEIRIDHDVFKMEQVPIEHFPEVMLALERWYEERSQPLPVLHGALVFGSPTEQPNP